MQNPGRLALYADRYTPFVRTLTFRGLDLNGVVTCRAQVRERKNGGAILADMVLNPDPAAEGIYLASVVTVGDVTTSIIVLRALEATMEAMPLAAEIDADATFYWDLQIEPDGGTNEVYLAGPFIVRAGVTI